MHISKSIQNKEGFNGIRWQDSRNEYLVLDMMFPILESQKVEGEIELKHHAVIFDII